MDKIRQDGKTVLSGSNGISIPMFFNNLTGKSFGGKEYEDYIRYIALQEMGFHPGSIELYRDGKVIRQGIIPNV